MISQLRSRIAFWTIESVLLVVAILFLGMFLYAPYDPTENADRKLKIMIGSSFLLAATLGGMYGVWAIARAMGL